MPLYRPEIAALRPYAVGRPIEEVARDLDLDPASIIKLTANESPEGPFPGVGEAVAGIVGQSNRYPDNDLWELSHKLAAELGIARESLLFGAGSTALIAAMISATGGPGTNVVYGWPSFVMYRFSAVWAGADHVEVPLDDAHALDLEAMERAVDDNTRVVIVCNPNNPTGTIKPSAEVEAFISSLPEEVLVVVDEAYHEFVGDERYATAIPMTFDRPNVVVVRTFSKIYGLAAFRIGYAIGDGATVTEVRKAMPPLTVTSTAQAAALASLGQSEELKRRVDANAAARHHVQGALSERGITYAESHTNFIYFKPSAATSEESTREFTERGVILRPMGDGWLRVTLGSPDENRKFIEVLDSLPSQNA